MLESIVLNLFLIVLYFRRKWIFYFFYFGCNLNCNQVDILLNCVILVEVCRR
jgi:hypothetical protein